MKEELIMKAISANSNISHLAKEYSVSRKTIYKWLNRYQEEGCEGLIEQSRMPSSCDNRVSHDQVEVILQTRDKFPYWGARKLRAYLIQSGHVNIPSESTFNRVLKRNDRINPEESESRQHFIRFEKATPNELWQMDFKGNFKIDNGKCYPLTVIDDHSRFSIIIKACHGESYEEVREGLKESFIKYGMPEAITMDNGSPWKGCPPFKLSRMTVWLMRLGIYVSHSAVRHPQTQGKLERFHRSLKQEVLKFHQFRSLEHSQLVFDEWRNQYNNIRPHEGIKLVRPSDRYYPSSKKYPEKLPEINYKDSDIVRVVQACGSITYQDRRCFIGEYLRGEKIALRSTVTDGEFHIYFMNCYLGKFKISDKKKHQTIYRSPE